MKTKLLLGALLLCGCASAGSMQPGEVAVPPVAREFRGVWVATVSNIDWPSRRGLPADSQKAELIAILDRAVALKQNAILFQVRTAADALYESQLEPWSEYLTGTQGQSPGYDPLAFAVEQAHARGLELHAWFNPYRARHPSAQSAVAQTHLSVTRPELVRTYGTHLWMDPGEPAVQDHSINVMLDVLRRYDVDGIHIDDYFYPYRELDANRQEIDFPDSASYARYRAAGGGLGRGDWRRHNVDSFVKRLNEEIHQVKPQAKFGVSPIGMWRPGHPPEGCCFDAYEQIYADARLWLAEGWLDYFVPQLYRSMSDTLMNYGVMLGWWAEQNERDKHVYVGLIPNSVRPDNWPATEIVGQVFVARGHPGAEGHVHFSARSLMRNDSLVERLQRTVYRFPALAPVMPWLGTRTPTAPSLSVQGERLRIEAPGARNYVVRWRTGTRWQVELVAGSQQEIPLRPGAEEVAVSAVDRMSNESAVRRLRIR